MSRLPIGVQDFRKLRTEGLAYVDKTEQVYNLMNLGQHIFFSRPRRFGKSLLISTLKEIFSGSKELFEGLWIEDKIDWKTYPVIHIDFNEMNYRELALEAEIARTLDENAERNGVELSSEDSKGKFRELFKQLAVDGEKVVVLVDEYDKALTDYLEDNERARENANILKNFYSVLKSQDKNIHFNFITGVSKYGKVSIFSDLNNLFDATMHDDLAALCGYTQEELQGYFSEELYKLCLKGSWGLDDLLQGIKLMYNGYSWDGRQKVYNPFSVLNFFNLGKFEHFWFATGTPTFLMKLMKEQQLASYELELLKTSGAILENNDLNNIGIQSLLFSTGYLTIKKEELKIGRTNYQLGFPNEEVRTAFMQYLLSTYIDRTADRLENDVISNLTDGIEHDDWELFFETINEKVFARAPYGILPKKESYVHSIIHMLMVLTGYEIHSEVQTRKGRMGSVLDTGDRILIFEFKIDRSAEEAVEQIKEMKYYEMYAHQEKPLTVVGVNFDTEKKEIDDYVVKNLDNSIPNM
ncbi:ATP-binding protein [Aureibacter tunicatorum]|uniref:Succinate dehydrogenase flavin-adding protein (Antitoxin of CptAB toxin-antitoxin module) n=1 Tax=Aureibacter tunicatorum TaxID=866807 RepID=A0AAE3XRN5_9BACT|nr:AAA family ATPase [Aureibacter tunicatorum]MDR6240690.1 succinate dehydrogenase flavin-adding protein (antitoxin of CptAB toxin-antitoxin module) [Aureibacter tunicatorum]BDD06977.1 ATPase AAA [Aureibacter tunicatorum]